MTGRILAGKTIEVALDLVTEECCECHMLFAMPADLRRRLKEKPGLRGLSFFCPAGHEQYYTGESEADKLRRERDRLAQRIAEKDDEIVAQRARADAERRRANGYKGHAAKITKRAKAGVCPCCNRHFVQLERHMTTQHPDFTPLALEGAA